MPKILDAGTVIFSNGDMLDWIDAKRQQHKQENADDKQRGIKGLRRPEAFMKALKKHERELEHKSYPFRSNPGAYTGENRNKSLQLFMDRCDEEITYPAEDETKETGLEGDALLAAIQEQYNLKAFSMAELMQIQNVAPQNTEMLQNMLDRPDKRFSVEELQKIVQIIKSVYRCGDEMPEAHVNGRPD